MTTATTTTTPVTTRSSRTKKGKAAEQAQAAPVVTLTAATTVGQAALKERLALVKSAVAKKSVFPVLTHVLIEAKVSGTLRLAATDLELASIVMLPAAVNEAWSLCVPFGLLNDVVSGLPNEPITLKIDPRTQTLNLRCGGFNVNIKGIEADEFPAISAIVADRMVRLPRSVFTTAVQQVAPAIADEHEHRPTLTSMLVESKAGTLTLAGTDTFRLTIRKIAVPDADTFSVLVPGSAAERIAGVIRKADGDDEITIAVNPDQTMLMVAAAGAVCITRLMEGRFANYQAILPTRCTTRVVIDVAEAHSAVKLASFFAAKSAHQVRINVGASSTAASGAALTITANGADTGDNEGIVPVLSAQGEYGRIAFDDRYLAEALAAMPTTRAAFEMTRETAPGVLRPVADTEGQEVDDLTIVLMPMTIR